MKFVRIKAGTFTMGAGVKEVGRSGDDGAHEVTLTKDYLLGTTELTRGQFKKFVDDTGYKTDADRDGGDGWDADTKGLKNDKKYNWKNPGFAQTDDHPVVMVSWNDAVKFAAWLSKKEGREYRLPTEAEWEYACRGGTTTSYHFGDNEEDLAKYGNVADASFRKTTGQSWGIKADDSHGFTAPVGSYKPNQFGLFDMYGNATEWCSDLHEGYTGEKQTDPKGGAKSFERVFRGGSWYSAAGYCRSASRGHFRPASCYAYFGFRLALVPSDE